MHGLCEKFAILYSNSAGRRASSRQTSSPFTHPTPRRSVVCSGTTGESTRGVSTCREAVQGRPLLRPSRLAYPSLDALQHTLPNHARRHALTRRRRRRRRSCCSQRSSYRPAAPRGTPRVRRPPPNTPSPSSLPRSRYLRQSGLASIPRAGRDSEKQDPRHFCARRYLEAIPCAIKANLRVNRGTAVRRVCTYFLYLSFLAGHVLRLASRSHVIHDLLGNALFLLLLHTSITLLLLPERLLTAFEHRA